MSSDPAVTETEMEYENVTSPASRSSLRGDSNTFEPTIEDEEDFEMLKLHIVRLMMELGKSETEKEEIGKQVHDLIEIELNVESKLEFLIFLKPGILENSHYWRPKLKLKDAFLVLCQEYAKIGGSTIDESTTWHSVYNTVHQARQAASALTPIGSWHTPT